MQARIQGAVGAVAPQKRNQKKGEKEKGGRKRKILTGKENKLS